MIFFLQMLGVLIFVGSFFFPLAWCWGHCIGFFLIAVGSYLYGQNKKSAKRHQQMMRALHGRRN